MVQVARADAARAPTAARGARGGAGSRARMRATGLNTHTKPIGLVFWQQQRGASGALTSPMRGGPLAARGTLCSQPAVGRDAPGRRNRA